MIDPSIESETRNHAWQYFALHAQQRLSAFQFYISLTIGLFGLALLGFQLKPELAGSLSVVGVCIALLSFIFWKIDQRTADMIKAAEKSLREVEQYLLRSQSNVTTLPFSADTQAQGTIRALPLVWGRLTYSKSFGVVFLGSGILGLSLTAVLITN